MNRKAMSLTAVFIATLAAGCASPYLTTPSPVMTVSNGVNSWDISQASHGSNTVYAAECFARASSSTESALPVLSRQNDNGHDIYALSRKGQRLYMASCKDGEKVTTLNNVEMRNFGRGENRPFTQFTVLDR